MKKNICWSLCAASAAGMVILGGDRGILSFVAADSLLTVLAAVAIAAIWNHSDQSGELLPRAAQAAMAGGALATIVNASITLIREPDAALIPLRLAQGLTGVLYGAMAAGLLLVAAARASETRPIKASF